VRIRADWRTHLHDIRRWEIELIFSGCAPQAFAEALELGAGDGFQSGLLSRYVGHLTSTDYDPAILSLPSTPAVTYRIGDAEEVDKAFPTSRFDLVFSSNLLEHVTDPVKTLRGIGAVLKEDGITIHVIPNPFWKLASLLLYLPDRIVARLERATEPGARTPQVQSPPFGNNPKTPRPRRSFLARQVWPEPHGVSATHWEEFRAFALSRWQNVFETAGLRVVAILKGPVASGYGFGFETLRGWLARLGFSTEYVYVAAKPGQCSPHEDLFRTDRRLSSRATLSRGTRPPAADAPRAGRASSPAPSA
jgi:SAM-dependent methyltransferase